MASHRVVRLRSATLSLLGLLILTIAVGVVLRQLARLAGAADLRAVKRLAHDRTPALTSAAHAVSWLGREWVLASLATVLLVTAVALWRAGHADRRAQAAAGLIGALGANVVQNAVKVLVDRPRPPVAHLEHVVSSSFPSGHATQITAFLVAILLTWPTRSWHWALAAVAALTVLAAVALSRVYLGVHYPTDVAAGILLGGLWAAAAARSMRILAPPG